jgi:hypothetical protein
MNGKWWCFCLEQTEKAYWNHEIAKVLGIGESTLRKWCIELEKNGYEFVKGAKDSRAFLEHDLQALTYFKQLTKTDKCPKEQAAQIVVEKFNRTSENGRTLPVPAENTQSLQQFEEKLNQLLEQSKRQEEFNKALLLKLEQQENYIKESLERRDKLLLESIRSTQEQVAAAQEESKFKNRIKRLFGLK